eukprot:IDg4748t1
MAATEDKRGGKSSKHMTAVVAVSAYSRRAPPLYIVSGKHIMQPWFELLSAAEHINKFVRIYVDERKPYCLKLDGHESRLGTDWLRCSAELRYEIVQAPSDT